MEGVVFFIEGTVGKTTWCGKIKKDEWECYQVVTTQTKASNASRSQLIDDCVQSWFQHLPGWQVSLVDKQDCLGLGLGLGEWLDNLTATTRSDVLRLSLLYTNRAFRDMFCCVRWFNTTGCFYNPLIPLTKDNK